MKMTLVPGDIQYPYQDSAMLRKILDFAADSQPETIALIGDGPDFKEVSRWSKGTAEEYKPTLGDNILGFRKEVLVPLREECPNSEIIWVEGNHCKRIKDFTRQYGYPLQFIKNWRDEKQTLSMESLFGLDELEIQYRKGPVQIAPRVIAVHGHEAGGYSATPGAWDLKFLKRHGSDWSVVFGHTHQPFLNTTGFGFNGEIKNRFVMNVGSIMRPETADYVTDGAVSWTHSFGVIHDDGVTSWPELVVAQNGSFVYGGDLY
jgi:predicted phosphodiesterase